MQEKSPGILLYGYHKADAQSLQKNLTEIFGEQLQLKSATENEKKQVKSLLEITSGFQFQDNHPKIMLFFGMNDESIQKILSSFPTTIQRPIFCGLTKHNISWKFEELIEHLLQEQEMMKQQIAHRQNQYST